MSMVLVTSLVLSLESIIIGSDGCLTRAMLQCGVNGGALGSFWWPVDGGKKSGIVVDREASHVQKMVVAQEL